MTVLGALGVLVGLAITAGGAGVLWVDQTQRDGQGFVMSPSEHLSTTGYAITAGYQRTSDALETRSLGVDLNGPSWLFNRDRLGTLRIHLRGAGHPVFVGIATTTAADRYLSGVGHASLTGFRDGSPSYATQSGHQPAAPPAAQRFWASSASGRGDVALSWRVQRGNWTIVIMNADAAKGISADARLGARLGFLGELSAGLLATGLISGALAATLMILGIRRLNRASHTQ
jgi:hypothetical protein